MHGYWECDNINVIKPVILLYFGGSFALVRQCVSVWRSEAASRRCPPHTSNLRKDSHSLYDDHFVYANPRFWFDYFMSFIQEIIAKNDDPIGLWLIMEKKNNGFINQLASKAFVLKATCKFNSSSFSFMINYVLVGVYLYDLLWMYLLLYPISY